MSKLVWDKIGERLYETGVRNGVLYPQDAVNGDYPAGVAWNGLTAITESPSGAEATPMYADNIKYLNLISAEEFGCSIEAYTYPDEFAACDGSAELSEGIIIGQQTRRTFGLCYQTALGNDIEGSDYGYKLHLVYGGIAAPSERAYATINDSPEAITFSWEVTTTPVTIPGFKPTATLTINSTKVDPTKLAILEDMLYGTAVSSAMLPSPSDIATLFAETTPSALALSSIIPVDDATGIAVDANVVMTFNNKILTEAVVVTDEFGGIVSGVKSFDSTGKILTFNPTSNLSASTVYIVTIGGITDIYGQGLTAVVKNFETV